MKSIFVILFMGVSLLTKAKTFAVVVGVSKYDNPKSNLRYAAKDAETFYAYLKNSIVGADLVMITDEDATKATVLSYLQQKFSLATESDEVIFFFSGHGSPGKFLCHDSPNGGNYLTHDEVKAAFKSSKAKIKLCFADACFSGSIRKTKAEYTKSKVDSTGLKSVKDFELIVFMSSQPWQTSLEKGALGQGVFTYYIIEGLKGYADADNAGGITAKELYVYVRNKVMVSTENKQTPIMFGKFDPQLVVKQ
jgi:uncharacterized caspase-like protein